MTIRIVTPPAMEPVTLADAKAQCNIRDSETAHNAVLTRMIAAARRWAEGHAHRAFIMQEREFLLDGFGSAEIRLKDGPVSEIVSVKYTDASGLQVELAPEDFQADIYSDPVRIRPAYGKGWPTAREQLNAVAIRYKAGFANAEAVPEDVKSAILLVVADLFEHREDSIESALSSVPKGAEALLDRVQSWS